MNEFTFARQPILDDELQLYAYEFLYRPSITTTARTHSSTSEVLVSSIIDLGLEKASNNNPAFINMSYQDIMSEHIEALPADKLILELLEDITPDDALVARVKDLSDKGFRFALDDFVYSPDWDPLIDLVGIIKLDLTISSFEENKTLINKLSSRNIVFLAEKVETHSDYQAYKDIGCTLFQGYFFCRPETLKGIALSANSLSKTKLLSIINQATISFDELEETIEKDPSLTYLLLKYLNSAQFSFATKIDSIKQAIVILGLNNIKKWSTLVTLRNISSKPSELVRQALIRARLAELLAINSKQSNSSGFFLTGLLSVLDALLDTPLKTIIQSMPLDADISLALLEHKGPMGKALHSISLYDSEQEEEAGQNVSAYYLEACQWADQVMSAMKG
ncbi:MAG: HDOD domain-containing protein [Cycloclasticus sp.]|nr:HDOD domain-containing protein [Cycloclasticus sp.]